MRAGLTTFYNDSYHYEIYLTRVLNTWKICLAKHIHDIFTVTSSVEIPMAEEIMLKMESDRTYYKFFYSLNGNDYIELGSGLVAGLCTEGTKSMTFTGTFIGLFAENGEAVFKDFAVKVLDY